MAGLLTDTIYQCSCAPGTPDGENWRIPLSAAACWKPRFPRAHRACSTMPGRRALFGEAMRTRLREYPIQPGYQASRSFESSPIGPTGGSIRDGWLPEDQALTPFRAFRKSEALQRIRSNSCLARCPEICPNSDTAPLINCIVRSSILNTKRCSKRTARNRRVGSSMKERGCNTRINPCCKSSQPPQKS